MIIVLNILWIEDNNAQQQQAIDSFNIFSNKNEKIPREFEKLFNIITPEYFKDAYKYIKDIFGYDFVIIDIDLTENEYIQPEDINLIKIELGFDVPSFGTKAGLFLFAKLLELGFPKERMMFLTANANGFNDTYHTFKEYFKSALISIPDPIHKNSDTGRNLVEWLESNTNDYIMLRRGIIECCYNFEDRRNFLRNLIKDDDNIQLRSFVKGASINKPSVQILKTDIENYLDTLAQFLPVRKPEAINEEYRLFLRTLVHEWETNINPEEIIYEITNKLTSGKKVKKKEIEEIKNSDKYKIEYGKIHDIHTFAWLSRQTRNWVSHAKLLEPLNSEIIAFLFLVNMRAMFKLPVEIQSYEQILLKCISKKPTNFIDNDELDKHINDSKIKVNSILESIPLIEKTDKCGKLVNREKTYFEKRYFSEKINDIYLHNTGMTKNHDYQAFLFQLFFVNQQDYLENLTANSDDFLPTLARHIYIRSFLVEK